MTLLLRWVDLLKQARLEHADESVFISHKEVRAHEDLVFLLSLLLVVVVLITRDGVGLGERDALHVGKQAVFKPGHDFEVKVIETNGSFVVATDQVVVVRGQDVDWMVAVVQLNDLDQTLLVLLSKALNDQRPVPNKNHSHLSSRYRGFLVWNKDSFGKSCLRLLLVVEVLSLKSR